MPTSLVFKSNHKSFNYSFVSPPWPRIPSAQHGNKSLTSFEAIPVLVAVPGWQSSSQSRFQFITETLLHVHDDVLTQTPVASLDPSFMHQRQVSRSADMWQDWLSNLSSRLGPSLASLIRLTPPREPHWERIVLLLELASATARANTKTLDAAVAGGIVRPLAAISHLPGEKAG